MRPAARVVLAAALVMALPVPTTHAAEPTGDEAAERVPFLGGFLRDTRIVYPLAVTGFEAIAEKRFDDPHAGVSVRYVEPGTDTRWIDVFFYPIGSIDDAALRQLAESERESLIEARKTSGVAPPVTGELRPIEARRGPDAVQGYSLHLAYEQSGPRSSAMVVLRDRLYIVKGRYTVPASEQSPPAVQAALERFMQALVPRTRLSSSGDCWMPLPIEKLVTAPAAGDVMATGDVGGRPTAYLLRDRVVAEDPTSPVAGQLMALGMSRLGRSFDGCDGPTPVEPTVGESERELRIEYRAPRAPASRSNTKQE